MTQRKDGKPKKKKRLKRPDLSIPEQINAFRDRAYQDGYRDALKVVKQLVDQQLRETK